ncbi:MAG TPA: winged helix-turn-helix domain-containing protein [Vicinamibacteria bacterium]|nr:winged helix-turn-helix domain-containing protein [Vicinamibacteria bacterium]
MAKGLFRFGLFELDRTRGELRREGRRVPIQDQPLRLLELLVERAGGTVGRDEIRNALWPETVHVDFEAGLNAAVRRLREALDDSATNPRYVATVPRRGYRFIAPVETSIASSRKRWPWLLAASVLVVGVLALAVRIFVAPAGPIRVAVLPFENLSQDPSQDFLADGLTEELITELATKSSEQLAVIARTSVLPYKGRSKTAREVGAELDVDFLLEGSVRSDGKKLRIAARLVRGSDEASVWSADFERELDRLIATQREIASEVARAMAVRLVPEERKPPDAQAYELFLRGRFFLNQRSQDGFSAALSSFEAAVARDPSFAAGYVGLAETHALLGNYDFLEPADAYSAAIQPITRALELDPDLADAHLVLAYLKDAYQWDWEAAEREYRRAVESNPNLARAHHWLGGFLSSRGRHDEAIASTRRALELDPLSLIVHTELAWQLFFARRYEDAIEQCRRTIELDRDFLPAVDSLKWILIVAGRQEEAGEAFIRVMELEGESAESLAQARVALQEEGIGALLRRSVEATRARPAYDVAIDYATLGEVDRALEWLERAYAKGETDLADIRVDPRLDPLRQRAAFEEIAKRVESPRPFAIEPKSSGGSHRPAPSVPSESERRE